MSRICQYRCVADLTGYPAGFCFVCVGIPGGVPALLTDSIPAMPALLARAGDRVYPRAMTDYTGTPIPTDQAWRTFGDWKSSGREIGVIFYGGSGSLYTMGFVQSARNGKLQLESDTARASFNLARASFTY